MLCSPWQHKRQSVKEWSFDNPFFIGNGHCTTVLAVCAARLQRPVASRGWIRGAHHASCASRSTSPCLAQELSLGCTVRSEGEVAAAAGATARLWPPFAQGA